MEVLWDSMGIYGIRWDFNGENDRDEELYGVLNGEKDRDMGLYGILMERMIEMTWNYMGS